MRRLILVALAATAILTTTSFAPPQAQTIRKAVCGPAKNVLATLRGKKYREVPRGIGISGKSQRSTLLLVNMATGTWTVMELSMHPVSRIYMACVVIGGHEWEFLQETNLKPRRSL